jgi:hypothetical protein
MNGSYEKPKNVADIDFSGLQECEQTSAFPFVLTVLAMMTALQDEQKSFSLYGRATLTGGRA